MTQDEIRERARQVAQNIVQDVAKYGLSVELSCGIQSQIAAAMTEARAPKPDGSGNS